MDPTSALGAAAASAQFLGHGIKGLVYAAQLLRAIKGAPDESLRIVMRLEKELTSMNRLLSSDSATFSSTHDCSVCTYCPLGSRRQESTGRSQQNSLAAFDSVG